MTNKQHSEGAAASGKRLGLVLHEARPEAAELAKAIISDWEPQLTVVMPPVDAELVGRQDLAVPDSSFGDSIDVCVALGGDGTILRATNLVVASGVPIIGVNEGTLGYLTSFDPLDVNDALDLWQKGALVQECRMMVEVTMRSADSEQFLGYALNEASLSRSDSGHSVEVSVRISGRHFVNYLADGLIVATPTGSTAYSLSAGGPIVEPNFHALTLTPVAAHMVFDRSIVLAPTTEVELSLTGRRAAAVSLDGRDSIALVPGQSLLCRRSKVEAKFLTMGDRDFHMILKEKFGLVDR